MANEKGNRLPEKGNMLHSSSEMGGSISYEAVIAAALRRELRGRHRAKTLMHWTGASARTVKNWLGGSAGPSGPHLVRLMSRSDRVLDAVLQLAERRRDLSHAKIAGARVLLNDALALLSEYP